MTKGARIASAVIVPNLLTIARLPMAAAFPVVPAGWRAGVIVAAALSDAFDGAFSRWVHGTTTFGQVLDPIADKTFVATVLITLVLDGPMAWWMVPAIAARDLAVLLGSAAAVASRGWRTLRQMPPRWLGKGATGLQFLFVLSVSYNRSVWTPLLVATAVVSGLAGLDYLRHRYWSARDESPPHPRR